MRPWIVPELVEIALRRATEAVVGPVGGPALTRAVVDRSRRYTSDRERLSEDPAGDLAARACFFTVADCAKPMVPLAELAHARALPGASPLRVVDLGAGCGAMTIGLALFVTDRAIEAVLIDRDARALAIAARAIPHIAPDVAVRVVAGDVATAAVPRCDLVLVGSVVNELPADVAHGVVERAIAALRDGGAVIVVEPALKHTARALHELRDRLIAGGAACFAPCPHDVVPCPMLADDEQWCHEERPVTLPPRTRQLVAATQLRADGMKFSYLVMRRASGTVADGAARVVGNPRAQKGKLELPVCGAAGLGVVRLLRRHRSDTNRELHRAERGDLIRIEPPARELGPDHVVRVIRPADGPET